MAGCQRQFGGVDHAHRNGRAVTPLVAFVTLNRVGQGVAVVQDFATAGLAQVLGDDLSLHAHATFNELAHHGGLRIAHGLRVCLNQVKNLGVCDEAALDDLTHAGQQLVLGQGAQGANLAEHRGGRPERADQVLTLGGVNAGLTTHGGVHHAQQGGRNVHHAHAAQPGRRHKAGHVGNSTAAHRHDRVGAGEVVLTEHLPAERRHLVVLCLLGVGNLGTERLVAHGAQVLHDQLTGGTQGTRVNHEHLLRAVTENLGQGAEQVVADENLIVLARGATGHRNTGDIRFTGSAEGRLSAHRVSFHRRVGVGGGQELFARALRLAVTYA